MTGNRTLLTNFVEMFLGTVRFGNNDSAVIAGYGDVVIGSMIIKKVYYVEGLGHNLFSVGQFCDKGIEAEAIATACFIQNHSIIHKRFDKTPYELMNKRKPNIKFFRVFGCRRYILNDYKDVGKLKAKGDIEVFVGYSKESAAFRIYNKRTQEVGVPSSNTQLISNSMIPNVDEASTSHNVFNERLEDSYFDAKNIVDLSSEKAKGHGDWNSPKYLDTTNSGGKKETKALIFHKIETEEASYRYVAPCFINRLKAYDGEINLGKEENMISNEFAVKCCVDHEVKYGHKVVKKELIIALIGEIYSVKFVINPEKEDVIPGVVLGRSFMHLTKGIADFRNAIITIYPEFDPFLNSSGETEKTDADWDLLLDDLDFGDILEIKGVKILPFVCKIGKNSRNKRKQLEKYQLIYSDMGPSLSTEKLLTREEAAREALAIDICIIFSIPKEERPMKLDGKMKKEEEEAIIKVKGEELIEKEDPRTFVIPIRIEAKINLNALANTGSDINVMPYRVYKELAREEHEDWKPEYTGNYCKKEEGDGQWHAEISLIDPDGNVLWEHMTIKLDPHDPNALDNTRRWRTLAQLLPKHIYSPCVVDWNMLNHMGCGEVIDEMLTIKLCVAGTDEEIFTSELWTMAFNIKYPIYSELCHEFYSTYEFDEVCVDDELRTKKIIMFRLCGLAFSWTLLEFARSDEHLNAQEYWLSITQEENLSLSRSHASTIRKPVLRVLHKMITYGLCQRTTGWMKKKGAGSQKESMICCGQFITKITKRKNLLTNDVIYSLSTLIYYRALDTTTLRELIDS
uniref:Copia protein n=1 Tax=Tanacetum cinerariifolium TaxID=118510 RepID=A0A6L2JML0_TANCI|nr:copia protein [Tanacetum cinerariifolium]